MDSLGGLVGGWHLQEVICRLVGRLVGGYDPTLPRCLSVQQEYSPSELLVLDVLSSSSNLCRVGGYRLNVWMDTLG